MPLIGWRLIHALVISLTARHRFTDTTNAYRAYPGSGKTPTKISFIKGNAGLMKILFKNLFGAYAPDQNSAIIRIKP